MTEIKYMVVATFEPVNIKSEGAEFMVGLSTLFYCGDSEIEARSIYDELPNADKKIITAKVKSTTINNMTMVSCWRELNDLT